MALKDSENLSSILPVLVAMAIVPQVHGAAETSVAVIVGLATVSFVEPVADLVWTPLLKKAGLWWTGFLLVCALAAACPLAAAAGADLGASSGMRKVLTEAVILDLFYSWVLAALRAAKDRPNPDAARPLHTGAMWRRFRGPHLRSRG